MSRLERAMTLDELLAKQSITEVLYHYCRGLDRMDRELYDTVFEPGARLVYGDYFDGTAAEFGDWVWDAHATMQAHSHQVANVLIDVDVATGRAVSEAYVTVFLRRKPDPAGIVVDYIDRGRYLDRWTRQVDGTWRIAARRYVGDIPQVLDAASAPAVTTVRDTSDPSYQLFG